VIYYGGTLDRPIIECDCPKAQFHSEWCWHMDKAWNEGMTGFQKALVVHHDEMMEKLR
jgi:hypothetical protein